LQNIVNLVLRLRSGLIIYANYRTLITTSTGTDWKGLQNKAAGAKTKTVKQILVENIFSVFNLIILSIVVFLLVFYFTSGDRRLIFDSIGALMVAIINTLIAVVQEIRAKRALDKVHLLLKNEVNVIRDAKKFL